MTAAEAVETSVTNSLSQDYSNLDDLLSLKYTIFTLFEKIVVQCTTENISKFLCLNNIFRFSMNELWRLQKFWKMSKSFSLLISHKLNFRGFFTTFNQLLPWKRESVILSYKVNWSKMCKTVFSGHNSLRSKGALQTFVLANTRWFTFQGSGVCAP